MTGPIAVILAAIIGAAAALGNADMTQIKEEAARLEQERAQKEEASRYLIAIDPGHQAHGNFGQEPVGPGASETKNKVAGGATGVATGVPEYQLTLDISLKLRDVLKEKGYEVLMIRETNDVDITNAERAKIANEAGADVFIRIHANSVTSSSVTGAMTICQTSSNPYNSEYYKDSYRLSELVLNAYTEATGIRRERIWETDTMTGINWCTIPVTIIELGYMSNPEEDRKMQDPDFQNTMVDGLAAGIENYINEKREEKEAEAADPEAEAPGAALEEAAGEGMTTEMDTETAADTEPDDDREAREKKVQEAEAAAAALREILGSSKAAPACRVRSDAEAAKKVMDACAEDILARYTADTLAGTDMQQLQEQLEDEIGKLNGKWSLYLKRLDTGQVVTVHAEEKMVAASLIKLYVAGELYHQDQEGILDADSYAGTMYSMINVSDNGCANTLINTLGMDNVNEFARENGYSETELNRRMLEFNGKENYTSAKDCGVMLEKVLDGTYVNEEASEKILGALKAQERTWKIPAGVPTGVETANKTGELDNVDNDAAIVWSPSCTYILCIMSSDTGNRIPEIVNLSSMVYKALNQAQ